MSQEFIQASFNSGEWAPHLWARTDLEKYRSGAALLENWFVDYRGGASTRSGTKYIIRAYKDSTAVRLIPYQSTISLGYVLEFGEQYIRFHRNGAPVLESALNITGVSLTNPCVVNVANTYTTGDVDWVYISGINGTTQLNGKYFIVHVAAPGSITLYDLFGNPVDATGYSAWVSGGTVQRVYTISSPYAAADLALLKFVQNVDVLIICNNNYVPYSLTRVADANWTLTAITFGTTVTTPSNVRVTTNMSPASGTAHYSYIVTAVDGNGQESEVSTAAKLDNYDSMLTNALACNTVSWDSVDGAVGYNIYKANLVFGNTVPTGSPFGFIGFATGTSLADANIVPDFSQPPPVLNNPFATGSQVTGITVTNGGAYTTAPTMTFAAPPSGVTATGSPLMRVASVTSIAAGGAGYAIGNTITLSNGVILNVTNVAAGAVTAVTIANPGSTITLPANPVAQVSSSGGGTGATFNLSWEVYSAVITLGGSGYIAAPAVTFSAGAAAATAVLGPASVGNPAVPQFFQQRLVLAAPPNQPQTLYFSQPGSYYNYDISNPIQDDDSITATVVSAQISDIKSMIPQPGGLIVITADANFLMNGGGSLGAAITPANITANAQSHIGCNDMPPIVVNYDILSVQSKGSSVRDSTYNFYANVYTGTDISVLSSHLFFGYQLQEWAWAEEPYKIVWAVRNDGALLSLTFIKEQEFTAWTHHYTEKTVDGPLGLFKSVATIVEAATIGYQNFTYFVVQRSIGGSAVKYIEYFPERGTSDNPDDYFCVDCGINYNGTPATTFSGGEFLAGKTCIGLADGLVIPSFVMPASGNFTISPAASRVQVGLQFKADLQTMYLDLGAGKTVQSKMKQMPTITLRVTETLGLKIGSDENNLVVMKDLVLGNVGAMTNERVTALVTGDAMTNIDPKWQEQGQIFVRQDQPYPASVLGFIPAVNVGDMKL